MAIRIQVRRGTATQWNTADPVLAAGEIGFETNTGKFKVGVGGSTVYSDLPYFLDEDGIAGLISASALSTADDLPTGVLNKYLTAQGVNNILNAGTLSNISFSYNAAVQGIDVSVPTVQGTTGSQGTQGTQGVQGVQGVQGLQGIQGVQGVQGVQGTEGTQGTVGAQGTQGTQGVQGTLGAQGTQGTDGTQGVQGVQGTQGVQGELGVGTQGTIGSQGTQGVMGTSGGSTSNFNYSVDANTADAKPGNGQLRFNDTTETDATFLYVDHINGSGVDIDVYLGLVKQYDNIIIQMKNDSNHYITYEVTGAVTVVSNSYVKIPVNRVADGGSGSNSFTGGNAIELILFTTGLQGPIGAQGTVGPQGTQGVQGTEGPQGVQGIQGTQGVQGTLGTQGTQGTDGAQGTIGSQGVQGTQGVQGPLGIQGVQGTLGEGVQGTQGTVGPQGTIGSQGTTGTSPSGSATLSDVMMLGGM
jgi:hypothetical protein